MIAAVTYSKCFSAGELTDKPDSCLNVHRVTEFERCNHRFYSKLIINHRL